MKARQQPTKKKMVQGSKPQVAAPASKKSGAAKNVGKARSKG